ncbi:MAG: hypothetical protein ACHRHE_13015 [Tepidisphaerales bacterium]
MTVKDTKRSRKTGQACVPAIAEALEDRRLLASGLGWGVGWGYPNVFSSANYSVTDPNGNTYVAGIFRGPVNVATKGEPPTYINSINSKDDIFVAKYRSDGALLWAHRFGGPNYETVTALILGPGGALYMTGTYQNYISFSIGQPKTTLVSRGQSDGFIVRMTQTTGVPTWSGSIGGQYDDSITGVAVDSAGRLYIAGWVRISGNLAPVGKAVNITTRGTDDTFIERIDPASGHLLWYKVFGENNTAETVLKMAADPAGGIIASGQFNATVQFDRSSQKFTRTSVGGWDIYIADLSPDGKFRYVRQFGGQHDDGLSDMIVAANGDLYFTGLIDKDIVVSTNPAKTVYLNADYNTSIYITRMRKDGSIVWAGEIGGDGTPSATALALDASGNLYVGGAFTANTDFDPGPGTKYIDVNKDKPGVVPNQFDATDAYLLKLSPAGKFVAVDHFGGPDGSVVINDLGLDSAGNAYLVGQFVRNINIVPPPGKPYMLIGTARDDTSNVLVMKLLTGA